MQLVSYPIIIMASINLYTFFYYLFQYTLMPKVKENIAFSLVCLNVFLYDVFSIGLYNSQSIKEGMFWQKAQFIVIPLMSLFIVLFLSIYTNNTKNKIVKSILLIFIVFFILNFFNFPDLMLSESRPAIKNINLFNLVDITYFEAEFGLLYKIELAFLILVYAYLFFMLIKYLKISGNKNIIIIIIGQFTYFFSAINDSCVGSGIYPFVYLSEYTFFVVISSMSYLLVKDFVNLHKSVEKLNKELNIMVNGMQKVIESFNVIFKITDYDNFLNEILKQVPNLINENDKDIPSFYNSIIISGTDYNAKIISGIGKYNSFINYSISNILTNIEMSNFKKSIKKNSSTYKNGCYVSPLHNTMKQHFSILISNIENLTSWNKDILELYFSNTSIASDNLLLNKEITDTQKEIVYTLGEVAEIRSNETGNHVKRVAAYSKLIAIELGMNKDEIELLYMASPMHDIGKLGIPDSILNKPGKLTKEEFEIMKKHTIIGYNIFKKSDREILKAASIIALHHHEKYNGTGYPNAFKGLDIHIYGRIVALADVFDALGSERVYKKAWELNKVLELIKSERGKHFDPVIVDIFFDNLSKFIEIKEKYADKSTVTLQYS